MDYFYQFYNWLFKREHTGKSTAEARQYRVVATTQAQEDAFDIVAAKGPGKYSGFLGTIAHLVKGALGAGIMSGHVGFMKGGLYPSLVTSFIAGSYIGYCLYKLMSSAQIIYKRTNIPEMNYPDIAEAATAIFPNPKVQRFSVFFRHYLDVIICMELFGACACYQLIIARTMKQLIEDTASFTMDIRLYLVIIIIPILLICMVTNLKSLAPLSIVGNLFVLACLALTIRYAVQLNPSFTGMRPTTSLWSYLEFLGMSIFSMSCAGVVVPVSNNMKQPEKFGFVMVIGMGTITALYILISFFGYAAYKDGCVTPITLNFPLEIGPNILKGLIAVMVYITHGLNFYQPFHIVWFYIKPRVANKCKLSIYKWELIFRCVFALLVSVIAIVFPQINNLMGFLGAFCLSNMALICPSIIELLVIWHRPGLGRFKWRLWKCATLIVVGFAVLFVSSGVNLYSLVVPAKAKETATTAAPPPPAS
ncbi:hypothetical protein JYU34_022197 [Plutella xylostella]|uniref:Amino acid transporter transmembrane domain-containing protein n=1 Tax=Plutella xylostella TaxID=51655 RepID=A0ABQ7PU94_PLUXY|nr:hypothetical protein JYU34_022197 [Plutella xylostella]